MKCHQYLIIDQLLSRYNDAEISKEIIKHQSSKPGFRYQVEEVFHFDQWLFDLWPGELIGPEYMGNDGRAAAANILS